MTIHTHTSIAALALCLLVFLASSAHAQAIFVVNSTADDPDNNPGNGACRSAPGICTFRAAIEEANATPNGASLDKILFTTIPMSSGQAVIEIIGDGLPAVTDPVIIDGSTAAGEVVLDGTNATTPGSALLSSGIILESGSDGSTIRGLSIGNFPWNGILAYCDGNTIVKNHVGVLRDGSPFGNAKTGVYLQGSHNIVGKIDLGNVIGYNGLSGVNILGGENNTIRANYIGTDDAGLDMGNGLLSVDPHGSGIRVSSDNNTIGGSQPGMGNTIGFNYRNGITLNGEGNLVRGNYIGTDADGRDLGHFSYGVLFVEGNNTVGGGEPGMGNVIGFNSYGMLIWSAGNKIQGNLIGTNEDGVDLGNTHSGILLSEETATDNLIGHGKNAVIPLASPKANTIAFNGAGVGVAEQSNPLDTYTVQNSIRGNAIYGNDGLGIDLHVDGITVNDTTDADEGANGLLNFPDVTRAFYRPGSDAIVVEFSASSDDAIVPYPLTVDAYLADDAVSGEGKIFIGSYSYATSGAVVQWEIPAAGIAWDPLDHVVLTATDTLGNTSEFSPAFGPIELSANLVGPIGGERGADTMEANTFYRAPMDVLGTPYPNPFNPQTSFTLSLAEASPAHVAVYDALGRQVALLHDGELSASTHAFSFDGSGLATGVYFLRVQTSRFVESRRLMLVK